MPIGAIRDYGPATNADADEPSRTADMLLLETSLSIAFIFSLSVFAFSARLARR
jgi:hypothetical protein